MALSPFGNLASIVLAFGEFHHKLLIRASVKLVHPNPPRMRYDVCQMLYDLVQFIVLTNKICDIERTVKQCYNMYMYIKTYALNDNEKCNLCERKQVGRV